MMISFHLPPSALNAAVSGHPVTGLGRVRPEWLPEGAFLMALISQITFPVNERCLEVLDDSRSAQLPDQARTPR